MNISEIRLNNARYLSNSIGGIVAMSEKLDKSQPQVSHLIGEKPSKNIGNKIARQIEQAFNKPKDWLDHSHPEIWGISAINNKEESTANKRDLLTDESVEFALLFQELSSSQKAVLEQTSKAFMDASDKQTAKQKVA